MKKVTLLFFLICSLLSAFSQIKPHEVFGELFVDVQMQRVFPDSKTFPDCIPLFPVDTIMKRYLSRKGDKAFKLKEFVLQHFRLPPDPDQTFHTDTSETIEEHIMRLWGVLKREPDTIKNSSLIPLPKPYIVPGGRFREIYYWDSYFTLVGLKAAGRMDIVDDMIWNFHWMQDRFDHIPNGNRTYYLSRSQPPFYKMIVDLHSFIIADSTEAKANTTLYSSYYWTRDHHMPLDTIHLSRYYDLERRPRPESFYENSTLALRFQGPVDSLYLNIRSACESGWDFSSRWFEDHSSLKSIQTSEIFPVDLNSLIYDIGNSFWTEGCFNTDPGKIKDYQLRKKAIQKYLWNDSAGFFMDYNFVEKKHTGVLSLAGMYPLFFKIATKEQAERVAGRIEQQFLMPGGVVTTLNHTGEQWDYPNGWAPLQYITIIGLRNYGYDELANKIKSRFMKTVEDTFYKTGKIMEKYNVVNPEVEAGGGEYPGQDGFGWTNGVYLFFLYENKKGSLENSENSR